MAFVAVDDGACRELVVVLFSVERFFDASVVFLAFFVVFAVFKEYAFLS